MILTKDEVVKMARQVWPEVSAGAPMPDGLERFATLCRAPLVEEVERLDREADQLIQERDHAENWGTTLATAVSEHFRVPVGEYSNMNDPRREALEILNGGYVTDSDEERERDALKAELTRVRAGEPFGWYSAKEDDFMLDKIRKTHERLNSHTHRIGKYDTALFTAPQPAAQEPDCATTGACVRSGLYASHPSAVPVVRQMVKALDLAAPYFTHNNQVTAAIAAGQQYLKENSK